MVRLWQQRFTNSTRARTRSSASKYIPAIICFSNCGLPALCLENEMIVRACPGYPADRGKRSHAWSFSKNRYFGARKFHTQPTAHDILLPISLQQKTCDSCTTGELPVRGFTPTSSFTSFTCAAGHLAIIYAHAAGSSETVGILFLKSDPVDGGYEPDRVQCKHDAPNNDKYCMDWTIPDGCTMLTMQAPCSPSVLLVTLPQC